MNVSLPKEQKAFIEERVRSGGFGSASDSVRELQREEVEQWLLAALESPRAT